MEKVRYIDLLLTLRSEYLKLKDNFDGIIDDIEVKKPFKKSGIKLSQDKKYTSFVIIDLPVSVHNYPKLQLVSKIEKKDKNGHIDSKKLEKYEIVERDNKDSIIPIYSLMHPSMGKLYHHFSGSFGSTNVKPLLESDFFKLRNKYKTYYAPAKKVTHRFCFPFIQRTINVGTHKNGYEVDIFYNYQRNVISYRTSNITREQYGKISIPQYGPFYIGDFLKEEIKEELIPDDWKEFFEKHLVKCDKDILVDDVEYSNKKGRPRKLTLSMAEEYKTRLLVLDGEYNNRTKYSIRL